MYQKVFFPIMCIFYLDLFAAMYILKKDTEYQKTRLVLGCVGSIGSIAVNVVILYVTHQVFLQINLFLKNQ